MLRSSLVILVLALSASASAEDFDYSFLSIGYGVIDFDDIGVDGDGLNIGGSFAINDTIHVFGLYQAADLDFDIDASTFSAGIGYNTSVSPAVDLVARLSYEYAEVHAQYVVTGIDEGGFAGDARSEIRAQESGHVAHFPWRDVAPQG